MNSALRISVLALLLSPVISNGWAASLTFSTMVRSDAAGASCGGESIADTSCGSSFDDDGVASSFSGYARAAVGYGTAAAEAHFEATSLRQGCCGINYSGAMAGWTDRYIVPAMVQRIDFVYDASGFAGASGDLFGARGDLHMFVDGFGMIGTQRIGTGGRFTFTLNRYFGPGDAFAQPVSTLLDAAAGILTGSLDDRFVTGTATADYFHTANLDHLDLYDGSGGRITDIASIVGESGTVYLVGEVPEPNVWALLLCGLPGLTLARLRRDRFVV